MYISTPATSSDISSPLIILSLEFHINPSSLLQLSYPRSTTVADDNPTNHKHGDTGNNREGQLPKVEFPHFLRGKQNNLTENAYLKLPQTSAVGSLPTADEMGPKMQLYFDVQALPSCSLGQVTEPYDNPCLSTFLQVRINMTN